MPITASKAAFALLAIGAGSVLGYNWVTTGCPSGVCPSERAAANILPAAMTSDSQAMSCSADMACDEAKSCDTMTASADAKDCCPLSAAAEVAAVANTAADQAASCCDDLPNCCIEKEDCCGGDSANTELTASTAP